MGPSKEQIAEINLERLDRWSARLYEENATPLLLLGVSHGAKSGQLVVCIPEDIPEIQVRLAVDFLYRIVNDRKPTPTTVIRPRG